MMKKDVRGTFESACLAVVLALVSIVGWSADDPYALAPIRPGNPEKGVPFWNVESARFIYPPAFDFKAPPARRNIKNYRFRVYDRDMRKHEFTAAKPWASLAPIWDELPEGQVTVVCESMMADDMPFTVAGVRVFWKSDRFAGGFPPARRSYGEAAMKAYAYVLDCAGSRYFLEKGHPDPTDKLNGFPSKIQGSVISAMTKYADLCPARRLPALDLARRCGSYLLETSEPAGAPLEYWPQTYMTNGNQRCIRPECAGNIMLIYPANVGSAYVRLAAATGERMWLEAAERIAATYVKTRRADGTWPLVLRRADGSEFRPNTLVPDALLSFFENLYAATKKEDYRKLADDCFAWIDGHPLKDWHWEGQFEDQMSYYPYQDMQFHNALSVQLHLLKRYPEEARRLAEARDLVRYAEDQFVYWKEPTDREHRTHVELSVPDYSHGYPSDWKCPCVVEQYACHYPVNSSAAKLIRAFLAMGRSSAGLSLDLAKARTLADALTRVQMEDGFIPTWWHRYSPDEEWINCHIGSADALYEMHRALESDKFAHVDPLIGTEGAGTQYGGMQPYTTVPFGSIHLVPMTRTNAIGSLSYNSSDRTLLGFILTRQPAIWMGDWGEVRVPVAPAEIADILATPYRTSVTTSDGRRYDLAATAHAAWIRGLDDASWAAFPVTGTNTNRMDAKYGYPLPHFGGHWYADKSARGELRIGVSLLSVEQAKRNLDAEFGDRSFDAVVATTRAAWEDLFGRVTVDAPEDVKTVFYTGLYHALLYPRQIDENGRYYSAFDDAIHEGTAYSCYSLWDTFRAEHPLLTLLVPERVDGMMQSLVDMYHQGGWLPKWPNPSYTGIMTGSPAEVVLAEAWAKGFRGFDLRGAYEAVRKSATVPQANDTAFRWQDRGMFGRTPETRAGLTSYLSRGYVACDETAESVSRTQDFGLADCAAAILAEAAGRGDEARQFRSRSKNYTNLWNAAVQEFHPRRKDGSFGGAADLSNYTEQTAQTAVWAIPYDTDGLVSLLGGRHAAIVKLDDYFDRLFWKPERGNRSIHGNEPSHHCAYLYNRFGAPGKTQRRVREILTRAYSTDRKGFDGNEDCGQMSAWYLFSALGLYPLDPASGEYELGSPIVRSATLRLGAPEKPTTLRITVKDYDPLRWRVKRVTLNGCELASWRVRHDDLVKGGELVFEMFAEPETAELQRKIDEVAAQGGGCVTVEPGLHLTGQLDLRSNVELHLEKGAVLKGLPGTENYRVMTLPYSEGEWMAVVFAHGVTNVAVTGEGVIDGDGSAWRLLRGGYTEGQRPRGLFFSDSKDIRLEDFTLRDAACWGCVFKCCDGVVARRVTVDSHANANNDGFDIEAKNVLIEDCDVDSGDDAYCLKSNNPHFTVENVRIRGCVARSHCNGYKIGTATHGTIRNVRFENCRAEAPRRDFLESRSEQANFGRGYFYRPGYPSHPFGIGLGAVAIENVDGGCVEDIVARDIEVSGFACPIFVRAGTRTGRGCGIPRNDLNVFRNILIENLRGRAESVFPSSVTGVDGCRVKDVTLRNVDIVCRPADAVRAKSALETPVPDVSGMYPECMMFSPHILPAYGLYVDKADGVGLVDVKFTLPPGQTDLRPAVSR